MSRIVLFVVLGLNLYDHAGYVVHARSQSPSGGEWVASFREFETTLDWMKGHLAPDAVVAATNPALVHLWTGHKTITFDRATEPWSVWRARGARYIACLVAHDLPTSSRGPYKLLYQPGPPGSKTFWIIDIQ